MEETDFVQRSEAGVLHQFFLCVCVIRTDCVLALEAMKWLHFKAYDEPVHIVIKYTWLSTLLSS